MAVRAWSILGNSQKLDGGAMFGNAPRAVWEKWCKPDSLSRIDLFCRSLLVHFDAVESSLSHPLVDAVLEPLGLNRNPDQPALVLFEAGIGAFFSPELANRYGVQQSERHLLLEGLASLGFQESDVTHVVLSHLHFDHAGGLLPAYPHSFERLLFPHAQYIVGRQAWERARAPHARDRASFIPELVDLFDRSQRLLILESPADTQLLGGRVRFFETEGHTPGQLHSRIRGDQHSIIFAGDLIPGVPWIHHAITMGYDRFPEKLIDEKIDLYNEIATTDDFVFFTHDTQYAMAQIRKDEKGRYAPAQLTEKLNEFTF